MTTRIAAAAILSMAIAGGLGAQQQPQQQEEAARRPPVQVGRSKVMTRLGIVAASQPLAARAGVSMLERGGNAIDAAIAANAVLGLVEPHYNGIGGDLFAIYYEAKSKKLYGLNAGGWAPTGLTPAFLRSKGQTRMPGSGIYSVTVPGAIKGWEMMRARFGQLSMADILAPAIYYAEDGFPVTDVVARYWSGGQRRLAAEPHAASAFLLNGRAPVAGQVMKNVDLAKTMRLIAAKGVAGFYEGPVGEAFLAI